jgi:hypothetical protein
VPRLGGDGESGLALARPGLTEATTHIPNICEHVAVLEGGGLLPAIDARIVQPGLFVWGLRATPVPHAIADSLLTSTPGTR